jgi:hypothetical protein
VHPTDATRAPLNAPVFTGIPQADTAASGTNTKQLATCEFVMGEVAKVSGGTASNGNVTYTTKNVTYFKTPGAQTWTPPAEFFSLDKAEVWGAAGSPAYGPTTGAGAGAYSAKNNIAAAVGQAINLMVGAAGVKATGTATAGAVGGDTWFKDTATVLAKGGGAGVRGGTAAIPGGQASAGVGDVKYSGGQGGASNGSSDGGGGGGAAGPQGNGKDGATGGKAAGNGVGGDAADGAKGGLRNVPSPNTAAPTNGASADDGGAGGGGCSDDAGGAFDYAGNGGFPGGAAGGGQWNKSSGTSAGGQVRLSWTGKSTYPIKGNVFYNIGFAGLVNGEVQQFKVMEPCVLSAGLPGSDSTFVVAATAQAVYTLYRNGVAFATATIAAGATTATYTMANDVKCDKGDVIKVVGPATADTTLANGTFQLVGVLI